MILTAVGGYLARDATLCGQLSAASAFNSPHIQWRLLSELDESMHRVAAKTVIDDESLIGLTGACTSEECMKLIKHVVDL